MAKVTEEQVEAVRALIEAIPPGRVRTYGDIAGELGLSSPRIVGWVMRTDASVRLRDLAPPRLEAAGDDAWLVHLDHGDRSSLRHVVRTMSAPHELTCGGAPKVQALFDVTTPG